MCLSCLHWCMNNNSWTVEVLNAAKLQAYDSPAYLLLNYAFEMSTSEWLVLLLVLSVCTFWFMFLEHWAPWVPACIPHSEHLFDSRHGKTPSSTVVHNNNACRSAGAEIYPRWSCFPRRCTACMEQSTTISSNCFLPRSIQTPAENISICSQFWLTLTNFSLVIIL